MPTTPAPPLILTPIPTLSLTLAIALTVTSIQKPSIIGRLGPSSYCKKIRKGDPVATLKGTTAEDFKTFLIWRKARKNSRIKRQWIPTLRLDDSEVEKSALYVEDLCVLQNGLWVHDQEKFPHERLRVQESPINIFAGYTSTRPAALVGKILLLYEDIKFQVFPPLIKGQQPTIQLILNLQHIKRSGGKKKPKKFTFRDNKSIIYYPVIFIMALAITDNTFKNKFTSLR
ncbi:hypothetical protein BKA64DRAFT_714270 [Cadophora sp. MPI-SDFR-AT-0126]|nr:hypothetical protein BKA64DRAFT_714270 [Leotiomycetes sp. MPI-SDFR-AT-0126]